MDHSAAVDQFVLIRPKYEKLCNKIASLLTELLNDSHIKTTIEHRAKEVDSFKEKISREGKNYANPLEEITDLGGIRVIVNSLSDVELVTGIIRSQFAVDENNSLNKLDQLEPDRFGYLSQHYIVSTSLQRAGLSEWADTRQLKVEIQVRTALQHAWAVIQRSLQYKSALDVPKLLQRRLFRVSALLELADEELDAFGTEVGKTIEEYKQTLSEGDNDLAVDIDSLRVFVSVSPSIAYWNSYITSLGITVATEGDLSRDIRFFKLFGIDKLSQIEELLISARGWGEKFFKLLYVEHCAVYKTQPSAIMMVTNGALTQLVIAKNYKTLTPEILNSEFGFGSTFILDVARKAIEASS